MFFQVERLTQLDDEDSKDCRGTRLTGEELPKEMKRILVTGGTGNVGRQLRSSGNFRPLIDLEDHCLEMVGFWGSRE